MKLAALILLLFCTTIAAAADARAPRYPLKSSRTLHNDKEIALARENVAKFPSAKSVADRIIENADEWVKWNEADLCALLTSSDVPRAFAASASGCPLCGDKLKEKNGDYSWIIDPKIPNKVKCPVDGAVFPDRAHPDDGWGWKDPKTGEKFWFVAYYNHWMWHKYLVPACADLARAYQLTGDKKYAHQAAVMLHRIAEVYPAMDHAKQSRYGEMMRARGADYPGKVVNAIWECGLAQSVAEAYDAVWETIDGDEALQKSTAKTGEQIRSFIDGNFLEDAIDAYFSRKIRGNFGMHQRTLCYLALVRQHGESSKWFDMLMTENSSSYPTLGLNYALYNLLSNDGVPMESAPGYNNIWVQAITDYGDLLQRAGRDVFGNPRVRRMYDAVIDQINVGKFTPDIGDSGTIWGGLVGAHAETFQTAFRRSGDPRYAALLNKINATGDKQYKSFDSLFLPPIDVAADAKLPPAKPRVLPGFGLAVLNNPADTISVSLYYGQHHGHGHYDRLNFELFAGGVKLMPDNGYPDAMNEFVSGIYTWSKNTVSHNTVVVDAHRQQGVGPGVVRFFADSPFARAVEIDAPQTYPGLTTYRRAMIMVDVSETQSYFVDIFTVAGGAQLDYSLHGPPGEFVMTGGEWSEPTKGTLAGEDVPLAKLYDDATMGAPGYQFGFSQYAGSGYQHLFNVRARRGGTWFAEYAHAKDSHAKLRLRILDQPNQQIMLADARVSPDKYPQILRYLIARSKPVTNSATLFVSVIEPFTDKPFIEQATPIALNDPAAIGVQVLRSDGGTDIVTYNPSGIRISNAAAEVRTRATVAVTSSDVAMTPWRWFRASPFLKNVPTDLYNPVVVADVKAVHPMQDAVTIAAPEGGADMGIISDLAGRVVQFTNGRRRTTHTVRSVRREGDAFVLTLSEDILVGLAKIDAVESQKLATTTALPLAPGYDGVTLSDELFRFTHPVATVGDGKINLAVPLPERHPLKAGENIWLLDVTAGDQLEVPAARYSMRKD